MKTLAVLLCALISAAAWAQTPSSSGAAARQFEAGQTADFENWLWRARQGAQLSESDRALQAVGDAVARKDCPGAVAALNAGLAKAYPDVFVLAGAMFEDGICVRPNWDRAISLYQRAIAAGQPTAAARLAAGSASAAGGRDKAATLWWAGQAKTALPQACTLPAVGDDPDKFVAALATWPADRLQACFYSAAVMAMVQSEAASPTLAAQFGLSGRIAMTLLPAQRRIELVPEMVEDTAAPLLGDGAEDERNKRRRALVAHLQAVADRAYARYGAPPAVPEGWRAVAVFSYRPSK